MAADVDINTWSDADFIQSFVYQSNSVAVNLAGSTLRMKARPRIAAAEVSISLDSASIGGIAITDAANGKFTITISRASILSKLAPGSYVHDLIRVKPDTTQERIWSGTLTHSLGASR